MAEIIIVAFEIYVVGRIEVVKVRRFRDCS